MKKTEWFSVRKHPQTVGWYEYSGWLIEDSIQLYWNGSQWGFWMSENPRKNWSQMAEVVTDKWRGLYDD
jgi:hypothetical protein